MRVKVSEVFATVSARACVCALRGGGGGAIIQKEFVNCSMFDVINIVARNGYIFIHFICFTSGLNLYDGQLFIHVQLHLHIMKLAYACS